MISRYEILSAFVADISREISKISAEEMRRYGLRGSSAKYLLVMLVHGVPMTATKLSQLSGRDKADVSRAMSDLYDEGLIMQSGGGKYRAKITLTEKGMKIATELHERAGRIIGFVGGDITEEERELLYRMLSSISKNLHELNSGRADIFAKGDNTIQTKEVIL